MVKFTDGSEHTIFNAAFTISVGGRVVAERSQVPLDLAWGISVHKAQGMSVDQAELHLKNAFETGQVYGKCLQIYYFFLCILSFANNYSYFSQWH